ncbi:hypothetical protein [Ottowia sp. VDI28]|uniref:hypothetical protein n=1 Tax=Ottowia sp. VDI28 TaxID=3133968 RepID=UPI003C2EBE0C
MKKTEMKKIVLIVSLFISASQVHAETESSNRLMKGKSQDISHTLTEWDGMVSFGNSFCGKVPESEKIVKHIAGLYGDGSIFLETFKYVDNTTLTLVAGRLSRGVSANEDHQRTLAHQLKVQANLLARSPESTIEVSEIKANPWATVGVTFNNVISNTSDIGPFPLSKTIAYDKEKPFFSMAVHRMFARGNSKYEIAAMQPAPEPITSTTEAEMRARLTILVEEFTQSFQKCTEKIPTGNP